MQYDGLNYKWLELKSPGAQISHTTRGIHNEAEFNKYTEYGDSNVHVFCRELNCNFDIVVPFNEYINNPILTCPNDNSQNITAEWVFQYPSLNNNFLRFYPERIESQYFQNKFNSITCSDEMLPYSAENIFTDEITFWYPQLTMEEHWIIWEGVNSHVLNNIEIFPRDEQISDPQTTGLPSNILISGSNDMIIWTDITQLEILNSSESISKSLDNQVNSYRYYKFGQMYDMSIFWRISIGKIRLSENVLIPKQISPIQNTNTESFYGMIYHKHYQREAS